MIRIPFGKKHAEVAATWLPSAVTFGATAFTGLLYFTDWKAVLQFMPFYGSKFEKSQEE